MIVYVEYNPRPILYAASYPAYDCCCCTVYDAKGILIEAPLYARVFVCQRCGDTCCEEHYRNGLCLACWWESDYPWVEKEVE